MVQCRMVEVEDIFDETSRILSQNKILKGKQILITAGGTKEKIDPVRFISNCSSGKWEQRLLIVLMKWEPM